MILFFAIFSKSAVFGIDFGSEYIKVSMAILGKGIHVVLNQQSKRLSPSYFSFWNNTNPNNSNKEDWTIKDLDQCSWSFLDSAYSHYLRYPQNSIKGMLPLLGKEHGFTRRESFALILRHLIRTVNEGKNTPESARIVVSVDPTLSRQDRIALIEAVNLSKTTLLEIIDSPSSAAHVYSLERQNFFSSKPKNILFIDVGAERT